MAISRIYQSVSMQEGQTLQLDEKASHHLAKVLRAEVGEEVTLFNGEGGEYAGVIAQINKKNVTVTLKEFIDKEVESPIQIVLAQGIAKGEKMDFIVQKAVELGVNQIVPLFTERSQVRFDQERKTKRLEHWRSVIVSACEQSGRNRLPEILPPVALKDWLPTVKTEDRFVLTPYGGRPIASHTEKKKSVTLLIGPEGGLDDAEVRMAEQQHFLPLTVGPRILRTETATIAAVTVLQSHFGDMG